LKSYRPSTGQQWGLFNKKNLYPALFAAFTLTNAAHAGAWYDRRDNAAHEAEAAGNMDDLVQQAERRGRSREELRTPDIRHGDGAHDELLNQAERRDGRRTRPKDNPYIPK